MNKIPTLLIDKARCVRNIQLMANKALRSGVKFRPHFKTHQSANVAQWFADAGVKKCTVSSVSMANFFAINGWKDITIAFPVNLREIDDINYLAERIQINLLIESEETAEYIFENVVNTVGVFIDVDVGYGRTGILPGNTQTIDSILRLFDNSDKLDFKGFLTHAGHSYDARNRKEIEEVYERTISPFSELKKRYSTRYPDLILSYGDTPTASVIDDFSEIDELRPGNFVYYDLTQWQIGSCEMNDIGVAIDCPIVSVHIERRELVVYGGGVHFSKDRIQIDGFGIIYGVPVHHEGVGWRHPIKDAYLKKISQEHGTILLPADEIGKWKIGDTIKILPVHSCMAADLLKDQSVII